jgi:hypothetical protein
VRAMPRARAVRDTHVHAEDEGVAQPRVREDLPQRPRAVSSLCAELRTSASNRASSCRHRHSYRRHRVDEIRR